MHFLHQAPPWSAKVYATGENRSRPNVFRPGSFRTLTCYVSTKIGYLAPDAEYERGYGKYVADRLLARGIITPEDIVDSSHCMTLPYLKHELDRSLSNLKLKTIDLLYLHNSAEAQIPVIGKAEYLEKLKDAFEFFEDERRIGKIRFYGLATWDSFRNDVEAEDHLNLEDLVGMAEDVGGIDHGFRFIQFPFNLAMPEALTVTNQEVNSKESNLLQACVTLGIGAFTSVPLMQGRLVEHPNIRLIDGLTKAQSVLQFARSVPGVIAPVVGHKELEHVQENIALAKFEPKNSTEFESHYRV